MNKVPFKKTRLLPLSEEARWTPAQLSAFSELVPGFAEWYEQNYDEEGNVRREREERQEGE